MTTHPYRQEAGEDERPLVAQTELHLEGSARERRTSFTRTLMTGGGVFVLGLLPLVAANLEILVGPLFVCVVVFLVWRWFRLRSETQVTLRIEGDALIVHRFQALPEEIPLRLLDDVEIESKEVRKVGHDSNPIYGLSFNRHVAPPTDVARLAIVRTDGVPLRLGDDWVSHTETSEAFQKVRLFLRSRGWVPLSERADPPRKKKRRAP